MTLTAPDLNVVQAAWTKFMGYRVVGRGRLSHPTASGWGAPAAAGKPYLILGPESGETTYLRFVEQGERGNDTGAGTLGWTTTEITVQNTDQLYERLKDSPFTVTRPPAAIPTYSYLRAMHAVGPAGEQLNLTWITQPRADLAVAKSFVGRCFITVLGAPDLAAALQFYHTTFGNVPSPIRQLPALQLAVVPLSDGAKIEVDRYGPEARARALPAGGLPPGIALVTFDCSRFDQLHDRFITRPARNAIEPLRGSRTATLRGAAGELVELLES
ncbi:MAG: VOC family protein [Steroidobacteraceae bacterium]